MRARVYASIEESTYEILLAAAVKAELELADYCASVLEKHAETEVQK